MGAFRRCWGGWAVGPRKGGRKDEPLDARARINGILESLGAMLGGDCRIAGLPGLAVVVARLVLCVLCVAVDLAKLDCVSLSKSSEKDAGPG